MARRFSQSRDSLSNVENGRLPGRPAEIPEPVIDRDAAPAAAVPLLGSVGRVQAGVQAVVEAVVQCPDGRLRAVARVDLTEQAFHVNFDGRLGDVQPVGDHLIRITLYKALQDLHFTLGQSMGVCGRDPRGCCARHAVHQQRCKMGREYFFAQHYQAQ